MALMNLTNETRPREKKNVLHLYNKLFCATVHLNRMIGKWKLIAVNSCDASHFLDRFQYYCFWSCEKVKFELNAQMIFVALFTLYDTIKEQCTILACIQINIKILLAIAQLRNSHNAFDPIKNKLWMEPVSICSRRNFYFHVGLLFHSWFYAT